MTNEDLIEKTVEFVKQTLTNAEGGHDWWHVYRVWQLSKSIARTENVDVLVVELGALLHDIADAKFHDGDESVGPKWAKDFLMSQNVSVSTCEQVINIIAHISFAGGHEVKVFDSPELQVVRDADRLDAMGAIGIARTFNYGGFKNRVLYDPHIVPNLHMSKQEYRQSTAPTINHFYEKLLLLKNSMHTHTARKMAAQRHQFMELYLEQFYAEWEGSR